MVFRVCLLLAALFDSNALFADQEGSFDRLQTHIGPFDNLFPSGKSSIVVGTGANVVASVAVRTGLVQARFVLPEGVASCSSSSVELHQPTCPHPLLNCRGDSGRY